jgi:hypothetical protein
VWSFAPKMRRGARYRALRSRKGRSTRPRFVPPDVRARRPEMSIIAIRSFRRTSSGSV